MLVNDPAVDGFVGLGFKWLSKIHAVNVFDNILKQNLVSLPVFSFHLNREPNSIYHGELILGEHNQKFQPSDFTFVSVITNFSTNPGYWMFPTDRILVGLFMFIFHSSY